MTDYRATREAIYAPLRQEGRFTWDNMYGEEYALATIHPIAETRRRQLAEAAERLARIYNRTVDVCRQADDELLLGLGIPAEALQAVRVDVPLSSPTVIGRFDFAWTREGLKMMEFNSETPMGIVESYYVNGKICEYFQMENPNAGMNRHLSDAFQTALAAYEKIGYGTGNVVFGALDWHVEDEGTTKYLLQVSGIDGTFAPLEQLRVYEDRLCVLESGVHRPVDVLYRMHSLEMLAEDKDDDGYPTGAHVLDLIARRKLAVINPPGAFIAQSKALQAIIWNLHETKQFYTEEEHEMIGQYMLPTYLENRFLGIGDYVAKPVFGREGGGVTLFRRNGQVLEKDTEPLYWEQPVVYQKLVELEQTTVPTLKGMYEGRLMWGSFVIGGRASAVMARVGGRITGNLAYFLPVGIR